MPLHACIRIERCLRQDRVGGGFTDAADACALSAVILGHRPGLGVTVFSWRIFCVSTFDETLCSGLMKPDTHLGENARHIEVSDDQTTSCFFR